MLDSVFSSGHVIVHENLGLRKLLLVLLNLNEYDGGTGVCACSEGRIVRQAHESGVSNQLDPDGRLLSW